MENTEIGTHNPHRKAADSLRIPLLYLWEYVNYSLSQ